MTSAPAVRPLRVTVFPALVALAATAIALSAGWAVKAANHDPMRELVVGGLAVTVPADWLVSDLATGDGVAATNPFVTFEQLSVAPATSPEGDRALQQRIASQSDALVSFHVLDTGPLPGRGAEARAVSYVYVGEEAGRSVVIRGLDRIVPSAAGLVVVTYRAAAADFEDGLSSFDEFTDTIVAGS